MGFIGTGGIAEAMIRGFCRHGFDPAAITVTRRNRVRSQRLASQFPGIRVVDEAADVVAQSDWIVLAVLPKHASEVLKTVELKPDQLLISLVAGLELSNLADLTKANRLRMIPMPPIELGVGPIAIYPPNPAVEECFSKIGTVIELTSESHFTIMSAASAVMATFFDFNRTLIEWMEARQLPESAAIDYSTSLFQALATLQARTPQAEIKSLAEDCLTPGGLNEQVLRELQESNWFNTLGLRLDTIHDRITR